MTPLPRDLVPRSRGAIRWLFSRLRAYGTRVSSPPASRPEQIAYGLAQPILGLRILASDGSLAQEALTPPALLALVCAIWASVQSGHGQWDWFKEFYKAFAALAPLPTVIFANHYARLAAVVRWRLGFGACGPREMPMGMLVGRLVRQSMVVAIGSAPFFLLKSVPFLGQALLSAALAVWGLHWIVADAFDDAQVLLPGETVRQSVQRDRDARQPWFVRLLHRGATHLPVLRGIVHRFANLCDRLAKDSRGELQVMEENPSIATGFALSTAALLAIPGLNLLFRPIILVSSAHLLGHLEKHERHAQPAALSAAETRISARG